MSGYTKHLCEKENIEAMRDVDKYIKSIIPILPCNYDFTTIKSLLLKYYPYEVLIILEKEKYYKAKEKSLTNKDRKSRYTIFSDIDTMIKKSNTYKKLSSDKYITDHINAYNDGNYENNCQKFNVLRTPKIEKRNAKIQKALIKTQQVEPDFLDALIGLYDKKTTPQKDKVYILLELEKYYCDKVLKFFSKKIDTEYNRQLREMAFYHYQSLGFQPILRKQKYIIIPSKNKKRRKFLKEVYANEKFSIDEVPTELEYRINNSKEQNLKNYDYFISHSSSDYNEVQSLIKYLNHEGKNIYCDWINDTDYLKRSLVGEATLNVILKRISQSKEIIFVISENSLNSSWCKYELNNVIENHKNILFIEKGNIINGDFSLKNYTDDWYLDSNYKDMKLF